VMYKKIYFFFILQRKKSKNPQNFIRLSRLSTKLSIGEASTTSQSQPLNKKFTKLGKILSNKIFGSNKKDSENERGEAVGSYKPKPTSLGISPSTKYFLSQEETATKISNNPSTSDSNKEDLLVDIQDSSNPKELTQQKQSNEDLQPMPTLSSLFNNLQQTLIPLSASVTNVKGYTPKLSQKQYNNRLEKLNDINNLVIKNSKTKFLFI
jgi:hypothetical protein